MKDLLSFLVFLFLNLTFSSAELIIAVPQSSSSNQQVFESKFINSAPPQNPKLNLAQTYLSPQDLLQDQNVQITHPKLNLAQSYLSPQDLLQDQNIQITPSLQVLEPKSFDFLKNPISYMQNSQNALSNLVNLQNLMNSQGSSEDNYKISQQPQIDSRNDAVTITIKLQPKDLMNSLQTAQNGRGSPSFQSHNSQNSQNSQFTHNFKKEEDANKGSFLSQLMPSLPSFKKDSFLAQASNLASVLDVSNSLAAAPDQVKQITVVDTEENSPMYDAKNFFKSFKNLVKSQIATIMKPESPSPSYVQFLRAQQHPFLGQSSNQHQQQIALFAPIQNNGKNNNQNGLMQHLANAQAQFFANRKKPEVIAAVPTQGSLVSTGAATVLTDTTDGNSESSPIYNAASAIASTMSKIPSNLDLMLNDFGRAYRQNLFSLRDSISDMTGYFPLSKSHQKKKEKVSDMWLDGDGI